MIRSATPGRKVEISMLNLPERQRAEVVQVVQHAGTTKVHVKLEALPVHILAPHKNLFPVK